MWLLLAVAWLSTLALVWSLCRSADRPVRTGEDLERERTEWDAWYEAHPEADPHRAHRTDDRCAS